MLDLFADELSRLAAARADARPVPKEVASLAGIRLLGRPVGQAHALGEEKVADVMVERISFFTPDGAQIPAALLVPASAKSSPVLICGDGQRTARLELARRALAAGSPVLLPDLCGWGELGRFRRKFSAQAVPDETLAMTWYPLGRTLVGIRAENLLDCAAYLARRFVSKPRLEACGRAAIPAAHARFVSPESFAGPPAIHDPPPSWSEEVRTGAKANFADSVHGALAVYDWPDLIPVQR